MTHDQLTVEVVRVVTKYSDSSGGALFEEGFLGGLNDPLATIKIVFDLEDKYGLEIDDTEILAFDTVADIISCIANRLDETP